MMVIDRAKIIGGLVEFSAYFPQMRLGQSICNASNWAVPNRPDAPWVVSDSALAAILEERLEERAKVAGAESLPEGRMELIREVMRVSERYPGYSFGQLVSTMAVHSVGYVISALWDVEDEQLKDAAIEFQKGHRSILLELP